MTSATATSLPRARADEARRRVLMVSPHFPPDTMAAAHRVRLLAPYLPGFGWDPIVLTVDPEAYEQRLDPDLAGLVPRDVRVERCPAWSASWTRTLGIGDLGLRALVPAMRAASRMVARERVDAVFITTYPVYTALLGPVLQSRFDVPFVVDLQDPWVGAWGSTVGGGVNGSADFKSRASRRLAEWLEPVVFSRAAGITAVSSRTIDDVVSRVPGAAKRPVAEIPIGGDPRDFVEAARSSSEQRFFDPADGLIHICAVGTLLPLGTDVARAVFAALAALRASDPVLANRVRLHFFGTSNQRASTEMRALPLATQAGVGDLVTEHPARVDYVEGLRIHVDASALLLLGSVEQHYTASKLYPALLSRRPLIAVYHQASTVTTILNQCANAPTVQLITFDDRVSVRSCVDAIANAFAQVARCAAYNPADVDQRIVADYSAPALAGRLAHLLDRVA